MYSFFPLQSERTEQPTSQGLLSLPPPLNTEDKDDSSTELLSQHTQRNRSLETVKHGGSSRTAVEGDNTELSTQLVSGKGAAGSPSPDDMFTVTLDNIVDRHFQQLDLSLKRMMSQHSNQDT